MRCTALILLLLIVGSCNMFRNSTKTSKDDYHLLKSNVDLKTVTRNERKTNSDQLTFKKDSGNQNYTLQIWPRGRFFFSAAGRFEGEADSLRVTGKTGHLKTALSAGRIEEEERLSAGSSLSKAGKEVVKTAVEVERFSPSWKVIIAGLCVLLIVVLWLYRNFIVNLTDRKNGNN